MHKHDRARLSLNKQFGWLKTASDVNCLELNDDAFSMQRSTFYVTNCHHYYNVEHVNIALFLNKKVVEYMRIIKHFYQYMVNICKKEE